MTTGSMEKWGLEQPEEAIVEGAIGAFVFDKLRGNATSLTSEYKARGGNNEISLRYLSAADSQLASISFAPAEELIVQAHSGSSFCETFQAWEVSNQELALVERTIGRAYIQKLHGHSGDLNAVYTSLGGSNPQSKQSFKAVKHLWNKLNPSGMLQEFSTVS